MQEMSDHIVSCSSEYIYDTISAPQAEGIITEGVGGEGLSESEDRDDYGELLSSGDDKESQQYG